jgi:hypothetical protein
MRDVPERTLMKPAARHYRGKWYCFYRHSTGIGDTMQEAWDLMWSGFWYTELPYARST